MEGQSRSDLDEIRIRANIVEVVSDYVTLKKAGRNYVGLCPFHREKTPSFSVNPDKQIFYCFGCGEGGDVFSFLMKVNNLPFPEALKMLAGKLGIALPQFRKSGEKGTVRKEQLVKINTVAAEFYVRNLAGPGGSGAREYLKQRGVGDQIIREFQLGLAPDGWRGLKAELEKRRVPLKLAEEAGLLVSRGDVDGRADKDYYDRFRDRLMFPVENLSGQIIAFGGRIMGKGEPKYLNSPESPVYIKGRNLYGLNRSREEIRKHGFAILVEGYFDAISLWAAGIRNVAATLGTALTKDHLALLRRFTEEVVLVFDPDEAGRKAVERSLKLFMAEKVSARIVVLPESCDPDDYVRKYGKDAMLEQISRAQSLIDFFIDNHVAPGKAPEKNLASLRESLQFLAGIEDVLERNLFLKRISARLGIDEQVLKAEVNRPGRTEAREADRPQRPARSRETDAIELSLIEMILHKRELGIRAAEKGIFYYFLDDELRGLGESLGSGSAEAVPEIVTGLENSHLRDRLLRAMASEPSFEEGTFERLFTDTMKKIQIKWYRNRHKALKRDLLLAQESGDQGLCRKLLLEKENLIREEKAL